MRVLRQLLVIAVVLYFAIAAYGYYVEHHPDPKDNPCSCDDCDCLPSLPQDTTP